MSLYLAPRVKRKKIEMKEEDFLQKLPDLNDFKPFPQKKIYQMKVDYGLIVSMSMMKNDQYFVIADEFNYVSIYHTQTTRKIWEQRFITENVIKVQFLQKGILMVICEEFVSFFGIKLNLKQFNESKEKFQSIYETSTQTQKSNQEVQFTFPYFTEEKPKREFIIELMRIKMLKYIINSGDIHKKEEFLVLVSKRHDDSRQIDVLNLKKTSHSRIKIKAKSKIQNCIFHNKKPFLLIMTQTNIFLFDLQNQSLKKKLISSCKRLSDM